MESVSRAKVLAKQHAEGAKHQKQIQLSLQRDELTWIRRLKIKPATNFFAIQRNV